MAAIFVGEVGSSARAMTLAFLVAVGTLHVPVRAWSQVAESTRVRVLVAIDNRANLEGIEYNKSEVVAFCKALQFNRINCTVDHMDPDNLNPADIINYYNNLDVRPDDTLVFYYTGHGATDAARGPFLRTSGGDLLRSTLRGVMAKRGAHLSIILTDCCSVSGTTGIVPAPGYPPPSEKYLKDLFLRHRGFVDITAASYRGPGNAEVAVFIPKEGGAFSLALFTTLFNPRRVNFDTNGDEFFSWREIFPTIVSDTNEKFQNFKRRIQDGKIRIDDPKALAIIANQPAQTPQAFSLGDGDAADTARQPEGQPRSFRFGASIADNDGLGVKIVQVIENTPATRVTVIDDSSGVRTESVARLVPGDTILFANGVRIEGAEQFLRVLVEVPPGGVLEFQGEDKGTGNAYRARVRLDD